MSCSVCHNCAGINPACQTTCTDPVYRIRARYEAVTMPHTCTTITVTQEQFVANPLLGEHCRIEVTGADGKPRMHVSRQCTPLVDDDWLADVGVLLKRIDELEAQ